MSFSDWLYFSILYFTSRELTRFTKLVRDFSDSMVLAIGPKTADASLTKLLTSKKNQELPEMSILTVP